MSTVANSNQQRAIAVSLGIQGPYSGLRPYQRHESLVFFGRERQIDQLKERLRTTRFLGVVGTSGCGKSSLVKAGLFPALDSGFLVTRDMPWASRWPSWSASRWFIADMQPRNHPFRGLAEGLLSSGLLGDRWDPADPASVPALAARLQAGPRQLLRLWQQAQAEPTGNLLIVVDQFEELFRFSDTQHAGLAQSFVSSLLELAAQPDWPVYVAITMRSDFLGDCAQFPGLPEVLNAGQFLVPRLTPRELQAAIEMPARVFGVEMDPLLVTRILNDMGADSDQLPLLQHALKRTWDLSPFADDANSPTETSPPRQQENLSSPPKLSIADYDRPDIGGVAQALGLHAEKTFNHLEGKDDSDGDKRVARLLLQCLTMRDAINRDVRRPTPVSAVAQVADVSIERVIRVADEFRHPGRCFLTPPAHIPLDADKWLDISHESLLRQWQRLRGWVTAEADAAAELQRLVRDARSWREGNRGFLHQPELGVFARWREQVPSDAWALRYVTKDEFSLADEYLRASGDEEARLVAEAEAAREQKLADARQRAAHATAAAVISAILLVVAIGMGLSARSSRNRAIQAERKAVQSERIANNYVAALGRVPLEKGDVDAALLWWAKAHSTTDDSEIRNSVRNLIGGWNPRIRCLVHDDAVVAIAFSPDGETLLTGSHDYTARLWDAKTGEPRGEPMKHEGEVVAVAFSPDGQTVLTGSFENTARLWDSRTGAPRGEPMEHEDGVNAVAFSHDGATVLTGSTDGTARLWDAKKSAWRFTLEHQWPVVAVAFSPDDATALTGSSDFARRWNVTTGKLIGEPIQHEDNVRVVAYSHDGKRILTGCGFIDNGTAQLWDAKSGEPIGVPMKHRGDIHSLAFSPDDRRVLTGGFDNFAKLWDAKSGEQLGVPMKHDDMVRAVAFNHDGTIAVTGSNDGTAQFWDGLTGQPLGAPMRHRAAVNSVAFSPIDDVVLTGSTDCTARLGSARRHTPLGKPLEHPGGLVAAVAFSHDGKMIVTGAYDNTAQLWDAKSGEKLGGPFVHGNRVNAVAFSPDDTMVATGCRDHKARLWDVNSRTLLREIQPKAGDVLAIAFSHDGKMLLTGGDQGTTSLWSVATAELVVGPMRPRKEDDDSIFAVAFSRDDTKVLTGSGNKTAMLWDAKSGKMVGEPFKHEHRVFAVAITPDQSTILTGCDDFYARLWNVETRKLRREPLKHESHVRAVAFSPDGTTILTGSANGMAQLWDVKSGTPLCEPFMHGGEVYAVTFSPAGTQVLTGSSDVTKQRGEANLWEVPPPAIDGRTHPNRLRLSVEVRTGKRLDDSGEIQRLSFAEWNARRLELDKIGGPCDAPTWAEYNAWKAKQPRPSTRRP